MDLGRFINKEAADGHDAYFRFRPTDRAQPDIVQMLKRKTIDKMIRELCFTLGHQQLRATEMEVSLCFRSGENYLISGFPRYLSSESTNGLRKTFESNNMRTCQLANVVMYSKSPTGYVDKYHQMGHCSA